MYAPQSSRNHSPRMKVFTVGLDQKPPIKDATDPASEKTSGGSPPPGYVPTQNVKHIPLPVGPEIPQPPHPIVMRKSRGYKGILMVMLSVFLMALFALTLSEIAYNRQRDENFFRLRWAELKHRLGYGDNAYDYYHRANAVLNADRYFSLSKNKEMAEALIQHSESSSTTTLPASSTPEPVVAIDSFPPKPSSFEQQQQPEGMIRDARLQFLKTILQKIKQHAEDMGFDGTMQVSVIEVEPQTDEQFSPFGGQHQSQQHHLTRGQSFHPLLPNFFPHLPIEEQQAPKSDSFMDGFGEYHQPTFMQNNQVVEQNRARANVPFGSGWPREEDNQQQQQQQQQPHNGEFGDVIGMQWNGNNMPRANSNSFRPESFFHPMNNWQMLPQQQQQQQQFPQPPHILSRPPSFDRWSGSGHQLEREDSSHGSQQPHQPMIQVFPQQPAMPMLPPLVGPNAQQQQPEQFEQTGKSNEHFSPDTSSSNNASPSQEVVGEIYGRKFGRMLQDIIANRIQGFQNIQQLNPLMLPPSAILGPTQPDQRPRLPFPESNNNNLGGGVPLPPPPFFPPPPPNQQMVMPQQWWQHPANSPAQEAQQQIPPSSLVEESQGGKMNEKSGLPPPPPVIFFPMGQGQAPSGQPQPFPAFAKEIMGGQQQQQQRREFGVQQQLQFPVFKNFIPPEDRIQVEPPQQNFPNQPEAPMGGQQRGPGGSSNSDEPSVKTLVDNNMSGPRGWTHQFPKSPSSQQQQQKQPEISDSSSQESVTPASPVNGNAEDIGSTPANQDSKSSSASNEQQSAANSKDSDNGDVWLVAPPHRTQPPRMVDASTDDSLAAIPSSAIAAGPPAFSPPKDPAFMTTRRLSTASFIEPDQAVSFSSFAHISKQLPIKLSFTKNHQKALPPPKISPKLNLSSQNLIYHPLIAVEDNYSELVQSNKRLEPLPSEVYRTDSEASIVSGSSNHMNGREDKENQNFEKASAKTATNTSNFEGEREKSVENKFNLVNQVREPDFLTEMEKKETDDYDLSETFLESPGNRLSILPLNGSELVNSASSWLNISDLPEDQLTLRVEPQLIAATDKLEGQNSDLTNKKLTNYSGIQRPGGEPSNVAEEKPRIDEKMRKEEEKVEKDTNKTVLLPVESLADQSTTPVSLDVIPAGWETTTPIFVKKQEITSATVGELEELRKRGEKSLSGNTQHDDGNIPLYPEEKPLKTSVDPSVIEKEDGSEVEEEDHHVFGEQGLHTVDFPAVKFPMMNSNNEAVKAGGDSPPSGDALSAPHNDQQGQHSVHSNPVFFQVDDPSSIEQQPPRAAA